MARKNKYETHVLPYLNVIAAWCRKGVSDEQIAKKLGVAYSTFREYKRVHEELSEAMMFQKEHADMEIENALYKKAKGYSVEVKKLFKCKKTYYDERGKKCEEEELKEGTEEVYIPADTNAQKFFLQNRDPDNWRERKDVALEGELGVRGLEDLI